MRNLVLVFLLTFSIGSVAQTSPNKVEDKSGNKPASATSAKPESATALSKFASQLKGKLVSLKGKNLTSVSSEKLIGTKFYAIYYSAHWCPPCRAFTPKLVAAYNDIKAKHPEFELIFVSSDNDEKSMLEYMRSTNMPWMAVRFADIKKLKSSNLKRPSNEQGIPNLVFVDSEGKDLSGSYEKNGEYRGPSSVIRDIAQHFGM